MTATKAKNGLSPQSVNWNPWHGCHKYSAGCLNCYVYRIDGKHRKDANIVYQTSSFYLPISHARDGGYRVPPGSMFWTCFTSDFLLEDADEWRKEAWRMMRERADCHFFFHHEADYAVFTVHSGGLGGRLSKSDDLLYG